MLKGNCIALMYVIFAPCRIRVEDQIEEIQVSGVCVACMGKKRNEYRILMRRPEWKRQTGRYRRRWDGVIKIDIK